MTDPYDPTQAPPPSWAMPIAAGAALSFIATSVLFLVSHLHGALSVASCCCLLPMSWLPYGGFTALVARQRDPFLTPGQGFTVSFIGVGLGTILFAAIASQTIDPGLVEESAREAVEQSIASSGTPMTDEEKEAMIDTVVETAPFVPMIFAVVDTVMAGFAGMLIVLMLRRREAGPPMHMGDPSG